MKAPQYGHLVRFFAKAARPRIAKAIAKTPHDMNLLIMEQI